MSENTLVLFREKDIEWFAKEFDEKFDFKEIIKKPAFVGIIAEAMDKKIATISLGFANNYASKYIPDEFKDEIYAAFDDIEDGDKDYSEACNNAIKILTDLIGKIDMPDWIESLVISAIEFAKTILLKKLEDISQ